MNLRRLRRHQVTVVTAPSPPKLMASLATMLLATVSLATLAVAGPLETVQGRVDGKSKAVDNAEPTKPAETEAPEEASNEPISHLRVQSERGKHVSLEVAVTSFEPVREGWPTVALVGAIHIGDRAYYQRLNELLAEYDLVLYESVLPEGTGGAGGETAEDQEASTQSAMRFIARLLARHEEQTGRLPDDLSALRGFAAEIDPRVSSFLDRASTDAWGRTFVYRVSRNDGDATFTLTSYGADGEPGGSGADADLTLLQDAGYEPLELMSSEDGLQQQLADALGLEFQLTAVEYGAGNFRPSDMAIDQVRRSLERRGSSFDVLEGSLAGTSLPARVVKVLLQMVKLGDAFTGGAMSDILKVTLIEMLGDESLVEMSLAQVDPALGDVIIGERNAAVMNDLAGVIAQEPEVDSVAIFYGAGHMRDFEERLAELGYEPSGQTWLAGITVNLEESSVSEMEMRRIRFMIRQSLKQAQQMQQRR